MHDHLEPAPVDLPTPAASLIPHRPPVRLVEELLAVDTDGGMTATVIREDTPFLSPDGSLDRSLYLELIAQTFAAVNGWGRLGHARPPRSGYLVGATGVTCNGTARIGDRLTVIIRPVGTFGAFRITEGVVEARDRKLATGRLKIWLTPLGKTTPGTRSIPAAPSEFTGPALAQAIEAAAVAPCGTTADSAFHRSFCFRPDFMAFQGHFPGNPLVPAFIQVRLAQTILESSGYPPLKLRRIESAKFREPLRPGQTFRAVCRPEEVGHRVKTTVTLTTAEKNAATFQLAFGRAET